LVSHENNLIQLDWFIFFFSQIVTIILAESSALNVSYYLVVWMCSGDEYIIWEVTAHSGMTEPEARAAGARMREAGLALPME